MLKGIDGLAFGEKTVLYVNSVTENKLVRVDFGPDGKSKDIIELKLSQPLTRPDGMRTIGKDRLLMAENSGNMDIVTITGLNFQNADIKVIKSGLESTPAVTATRGMAWIAEGKLNYQLRSETQGQKPRPLQAVCGSAAQEMIYGVRENWREARRQAGPDFYVCVRTGRDSRPLQSPRPGRADR